MQLFIAAVGRRWLQYLSSLTIRSYPLSFLVCFSFEIFRVVWEQFTPCELYSERQVIGMPHMETQPMLSPSLPNMIWYERTHKDTDHNPYVLRKLKVTILVVT